GAKPARAAGRAAALRQSRTRARPARVIHSTKGGKPASWTTCPAMPPAGASDRSADASVGARARPYKQRMAWRHPGGMLESKLHQGPHEGKGKGAQEAVR